MEPDGILFLLWARDFARPTNAAGEEFFVLFILAAFLILPLLRRAVPGPLSVELHLHVPSLERGALCLLLAFLWVWAILLNGLDGEFLELRAALLGVAFMVGAAGLIVYVAKGIHWTLLGPAHSIATRGGGRRRFLSGLAGIFAGLFGLGLVSWLSGAWPAARAKTLFAVWLPTFLVLATAAYCLKANRDGTRRRRRSDRLLVNNKRVTFSVHASYESELAAPLLKKWRSRAALAFALVTLFLWIGLACRYLCATNLNSFCLLVWCDVWGYIALRSQFFKTPATTKMRWGEGEYDRRGGKWGVVLGLVAFNLLIGARIFCPEYLWGEHMSLRAVIAVLLVGSGVLFIKSLPRT